MTNSLDTSEREAEEPRGPFNLPIREMRDEPVPHQAADPLRAALQLALEAKPEELPAALSAVLAALAAQQAGGQVPRIVVTEAMHVAACKVLTRANGLDGLPQRMLDAMLAAAPEAPAQAAPSADEVERGDVVAFEFYNRATGHAIVDYSVNTHVGNLSADKGYEARPLVYADKREEVTDGSKPIPLWQAREALDELEAAARGDAPFNHQAAAVVRAALASQPQVVAQPMRNERVVLEALKAARLAMFSMGAHHQRLAADCVRLIDEARAALATQPTQAEAPSEREALNEIDLVISVLRGYPMSMARDDALRASHKVRAALASQPQAVDAEDAARWRWFMDAYTPPGDPAEEWDALDQAIAGGKEAADAYIDAARRAGGAG